MGKTNIGGGKKNNSGVVQAKLKVAINGFGRIGRNFLRCWHGRKDSPLDVIAINDSGGVKQASHLLKYDYTLGIFDADVSLLVLMASLLMESSSKSSPIVTPSISHGSTGVFVDREGAGKHIQAGAKKVLITAPGKGDIPTYVVGVNADFTALMSPSSTMLLAPPTVFLLLSKSLTKNLA